MSCCSVLGQKRPSSASTGVCEMSPKMRKLLGPATSDATLCADARDPVSLQEIWRANAEGEREPVEEIELLFSYEERHADGRVFVRGFALESVAKMMDREGELKHPVSGVPLPTEALDRARVLIDQQGICSERVDFGSLSLEQLTEENMRFFALEIFQLLATIDVRVDERIFLTLTAERLTRLALETREMLEANLPGFLVDALKTENGARRPFTPLPKIPSRNSLRQFVLREIRRIFLKTKSLVQELNAPGHLHLLAYVFVGALATVCPEVRQNFQESLVFSFELRDQDEDDSDEDGLDSEDDEDSHPVVHQAARSEGSDSSPSSSSPL